MTVCTLYRSIADDKLVGFLCEGHSGLAEEGQDILCAAVSALTSTAAGGLVEVLNLPVAMDIDEDDGRLYCMLEKGVSGRPLEDADLILKTMAAGLYELAAQYKDNLSVIEKET